MKFLNNWKRTSVILSLPIVSYLLLGPLEIYFGNKHEFLFLHTDFYSTFVWISVVVLLIGSVVLALIPEKISKLITTLVLGFGIASYVQNMFMNTKLSEEDGSPMRWETLGNYPVINTIIFFGIIIIVLLASFFLKKYWDTISMAAAGFLSAIQLVAVFSLLMTAALENAVPYSMQMSGDDQYKIARKNNIIVFVLDTYGNTQVTDVFNEYPEAKNILKDFTFYNNADCHYYTTFPSMTNMLTGIAFDFNSGSELWLYNAWHSEKANNFYDVLHERDYTCNIYSSDVKGVFGELYNLHDKYDNVRSMDYTVNTKKVVSQLFDMSIYRYVPYMFKPQFEVLTHEFNDVLEYVDGKAVIYENAAYHEALKTEKLTISKEMKNGFIIQHLFGMHAPYTINEHGEFQEGTSFTQNGRGLLAIMEEYFEQLKELDKYEDSTIIVMADHGAWGNGSDPQPIFFVKEIGESHDEMIVNSAPISLDDFQATILAMLGEDYSNYGTAIYDWENGQERERTLYVRQRDSNYPKVKGSHYNVYYEYTYYFDKEELAEKVYVGPDNILPATTWGVH